jgi:hypothetical protein
MNGTTSTPVADIVIHSLAADGRTAIKKIYAGN